MPDQPLAVDLCCGLGGWTKGLLEEGYRARGYDIEAHEYDGEKYPGELVLKSILDLDGAECADADLIVASPPCQEYSYMAMPWTRAKQIAAALRGEGEFPDAYRGSRTIAELNALFDACFRIQREASAAKGRPIPMVLENVRGAEPWVGRARWSFGSYYLWGDVPALMPSPMSATKVPGFRFGGGGGSFQTAAVDGLKAPGGGHIRDGAKSTFRLKNPQEGRKHGGDWFSDPSSPSSPSRQGGQVRVAEGRKGAGAGAAWFDGNLCVKSSNSPARKAASARIAKIPLRLSRYIAQVYKP